MDIIDQIIGELYSQSFYEGSMMNPTRFFILDFLYADGKLHPKYKLSEICYHAYCLYCDNQSIASRHANVQIRNLQKYGLEVIKGEVLSSIKDWIDDAPKSIISFDNSHLYLEPFFEPNMDDVDYLKEVAEDHFKKVFKMPFPRIKEPTGIDTDIEVFGKGPYFKHLLSEMQYCVCCDEYHIDKLVAVHILEDSKSLNINESRLSNDNGLVMCSVHAQEYLHGRFYFDSRGKVVNRSSSLINKNMRIGVSLLTEKRKAFLKEKEELEKKK